MKEEGGVAPEHAGMRLDTYAAEVMEIASRSQLKHYSAQARINGRPAKWSKKLEVGDTVAVDYTVPPPAELEPEDIPLDIIFEDDDVVVVNKPQGMVVHPAAGNRSGTLIQGLLHHCSGLAANFEGLPVRPGIVHRLDKDTSGVIIVAKNTRALEYLASQFRRRKAKKQYVAVVKGVISVSSGTVEYPIARDPRHRKRFTWTRKDGKPALTQFRVLKRFDGYSYVLLSPRTGRTHQLRVHLLSQSNPVVGDPIYGRRDRRFPDATLMLHAASLKIRLPKDREPVTFNAPLPDRFRKLLSELDR